jgi:RNA-binding protein YlmH
MVAQLLHRQIIYQYMVIQEAVDIFLMGDICREEEEAQEVLVNQLIQLLLLNLETEGTHLIVQ